MKKKNIEHFFIIHCWKFKSWKFHILFTANNSKHVAYISFGYFVLYHLVLIFILSRSLVAIWWIWDSKNTLELFLPPNSEISHENNAVHTVRLPIVDYRSRITLSIWDEYNLTPN